MQPAHRVLNYIVVQPTGYVDLAKDLSGVNRRLYSQGYQYGISRVEFYLDGQSTATIQSVKMKVATAGNTWTVHNAWSKAKHCWLEQQERARELIGCGPDNLDGPSKPKWEDFKVYLDDAHRGIGNEASVDLNDDAIGSGEWEYSRLVYETDDPAVVSEPHLHLIGGDVGATDFGLILAYQQSRATVQSEDPELPDEYSSNLYSRLAQDENAVADEVAHNMESYNDEPPYDHDDYVGNDTNNDWPMLQGVAALSTTMPVGSTGPFLAECGLLRIETRALDNLGNPADAPNVHVAVHLAPGRYKGVMASPMGQ